MMYTAIKNWRWSNQKTGSGKNIKNCQQCTTHYAHQNIKWLLMTFNPPEYLDYITLALYTISVIEFFPSYDISLLWIKVVETLRICWQITVRKLLKRI